MTHMPRVIDKEVAITRARRMLRELGYMRVSSGQGSVYFAKMRASRYKIRVSDHPFPLKKDDCVYSIEFTGPTIMSDVEYRVKKANEAFLQAVNCRKVV
jgi:hypothetical protein